MGWRLLRQTQVKEKSPELTHKLSFRGFCIAGGSGEIRI